MQKQRFDFTKKYGVVLEGGGAKGAYQIGVWKAMLECGVKISAVSGVSVGALNGALMAMGDIDKAIDIWRSISYSQVMDVDDKQMDSFMNFKLREMNFAQIAKLGVKVFSERGFDITPLKHLIEEVVDEERVKQSEIEFVFGTFSMDHFQQLEIVASEAEQGLLKDYLLASAYFPAFKNERLHGKKYLDGGVINNVPIDMLLHRGYQDILVIRIFGLGLTKPIKIPENVTVIEIAPRVDLGNLLEFHPAKIRRNMKIGYFDGMRCFLSLLGKIYYIDSDLEEEECLQKMLHCNFAVKMALLEYVGEAYDNVDIYSRKFLEAVCPKMAEELKLSKDWTYKELYFSLLELCAKNLKVQKYKIYTEEKLLNIIHKKYNLLKENYKKIQFPIFVELILKMMTIPNESKINEDKINQNKRNEKQYNNDKVDEEKIDINKHNSEKAAK